MNTLASPLFWLLPAFVAGVVALLHRWRPRPPTTIVAALHLWRAEGVLSAQRRTAHRRVGALLLSLLVGLSLAFAIAWNVAPVTAPPITLVLDDAPSMRASTADGGTRWSRAVARAHDSIAGAGPGARFLVRDTMALADDGGPLDAPEARAAIDRLTPAQGGTPRLPTVHAAQGEVLLFTDGVALPERPAGVRVVSVLEPAANAAITGFAVRADPGDRTRLRGAVRVLEASVTPGSIALRIEADGFLHERTLALAPGRTHVETFDIPVTVAGPLRATVRRTGDALADDDEAWAVIPPAGVRRVLLVTPGHPALERALRVLDGVALIVRTPEAMGDVQGFDVCVLDRHAPAAPLPIPALLFAPPDVPWLPAATRAVSRPVLDVGSTDPTVATFVDWHALRVDRATLRRADAGEPLVLTDSREALVLGLPDAPRRWIVGFAPVDSDLPGHAGFPILIGSAIEWLTASSEVLIRPAGHVDVPVRDATVFDGAGRRVPTRSFGSRTMFEAVSPGVFTVRSMDREIRVVTAPPGETASAINAATTGPAPAVAQVPPWHLPVRDPTVALLVGGWLLLLVEWATWTRRWLP